MQKIRAVRDIAGHISEGTLPFIRFQGLLPAARSAPVPPAFLLGAANALVMAEIFSQLATPQIGCYVLEDAAVAPTGIALKDQTAFCSAAFVHPPHHVVAVVDRLNATSLPVRHVPGPLAVIYGPGHETHGHWLTDFMPRLSVLHDCGYDLAALRFLVPPDLRPQAAALLHLCGIAATQLERYDYWHETVRTDLLLMPTTPRLGNRLSPYLAPATDFWVSRVKTRLPDPAPGARKNLFVSRADAPQARHLTNRAAIEDLARNQGLHIVAPEQLGFAEQHALFASADTITGEYGSALHNSIFSRPGTVVCALRGNSRHPGFIQSGIASALGQKAGYVFGDTSGQEVAQRFCIDLAAFGDALALTRLHARC
jgi:capsular polysaccharide biosynthesis protein